MSVLFLEEDDCKSVLKLDVFGRDDDDDEDSSSDTAIIGQVRVFRTSESDSVEIGETLSPQLLIAYLLPCYWNHNKKTFILIKLVMYDVSDQNLPICER